jgi:hypothetical protein
MQRIAHLLGPKVVHRESLRAPAGTFVGPQRGERDRSSRATRHAEDAAADERRAHAGQGRHGARFDLAEQRPGRVGDRTLKARAAAAGMSLSDYIKRDLERSAKRLSMEEIDARVKARGPSGLRTEDTVRMIREMRGD